LGYRCPNCGGELLPRPRRSTEKLTLHPASQERVLKEHKCRDYIEQDETLRTATGVLHGSLLLPACKPKAWVLFISGSGPTDRNGNTVGQQNKHNCLRYLALDLAAHGIASLRYDKRSVGQSAAAGANEAVLTFDTFIEDAKAWFALLRLRATGPVSIVGHSEGAQIATRVAEKLSVASVVNLCGVGRPLDEILLAQLKGKLPDALYKKSEDILAYLHELSLHEQHRKSKSKLLRRFNSAPLKSPVIPVELHTVFRQSVHAFLVSRMRERPDRELETLKCPVLIISGEADIQVSLQDYERLHQAKPDAEKRRIEGMNHVLKSVGASSTLQHKSYVDTGMAVHGLLVVTLAEFLLQSKHR
jgi:pimeloyl-ACP methyl ester carboxylesterase